MLLLICRNYRVRFRLGDTKAPESSHQDTAKKSKFLKLTLKQTHKTTNSKGRVTHVLHVSAKNSKTLKTALEDDGLLDKTFRMTKAATNNKDDVVAVPVTDACLTRLSEKGEPPPWKSLVLGTDKQEVPYSTVMLGQQQQQRKKK